MKRALLHGLMAGFIMLIVAMIVGQLFNLLFPSLILQYQNGNVYRTWSNPRMWLCIIQPFFLSVVLAWIWDKSKTLFTQPGILQKGLAFGTIYWVLALPGMIMTYGSFMVSYLMVLDWTVGIFVQSICIGWFFAKMNP